MVATSRRQERFGPDNFVQDMMDKIESLSIPIHKGLIVGLPLSKQILTTIVISIAFTVIGLVSNTASGAGVWRKRADMPTARFYLSTAVVNNKIYAIWTNTRSPTHNSKSFYKQIHSGEKAADSTADINPATT